MRPLLHKAATSLAIHLAQGPAIPSRCCAAPADDPALTTAAHDPPPRIHPALPSHLCWTKSACSFSPVWLFRLLGCRHRQKQPDVPGSNSELASRNGGGMVELLRYLESATLSLRWLSCESAPCLCAGGPIRCRQSPKNRLCASDIWQTASSRNLTAQKSPMPLCVCLFFWCPLQTKKQTIKSSETKLHPLRALPRTHRPPH
jgi:hypothetical protein